MSQPNPPKCIVLQSPTGDHLGFVLLAIPPSATRGECVFVVVPTNPALFDAPILQPLLARKALGESNVTLFTDTPLHLRIHSNDLPDLVIAFDDRGAGTWRESSPTASPASH